MLACATWPSSYVLKEGKNTFLTTRPFLNEDPPVILLSDVEFSIVLAWIDFHKIRLSSDYFIPGTLRNGIHDPWRLRLSNVEAEDQVPMEVYKRARDAYFGPYYTNGMINKSTSLLDNDSLFDSKGMLAQSTSTTEVGNAVAGSSAVRSIRTNRASSSRMSKPATTQTPRRLSSGTSSGIPSSPANGLPKKPSVADTRRRPRDSTGEDEKATSPSHRAKSDHVVPASPLITDYYKCKPLVTMSEQIQGEQTSAEATPVLPQEEELSVEENSSSVNATHDAAVHSGEQNVPSTDA
jgi:hypothetical protein